MSVDLNSYDAIILAFGGGKDSMACLLHLRDLGVDRSKLELWHHDVDGREGSTLMDWPVTRDYCRAAAAAFELPLYYSWKVGGFEGEMLRENSLTQPTKFECPGGITKEVGGTHGKLSTRLKFPQVGVSLKTRWCSALEIAPCSSDVASKLFELSGSLRVKAYGNQQLSPVKRESPETRPYGRRALSWCSKRRVSSYIDLTYV